MTSTLQVWRRGRKVWNFTSNNHCGHHFTKETTVKIDFSIIQRHPFWPGDFPQEQSITSKLNQYLSDKLERCGTVVLYLWKEQANICPGLANLAMHFLAIPDASCPSEGCLKQLNESQKPSVSVLHLKILRQLYMWKIGIESLAPYLWISLKWYPMRSTLFRLSL